MMNEPAIACDIPLRVHLLEWHLGMLLQVLCVRDGTTLLGQSELEVCYFLADVDDYVPMKCSIHPDAITGNLLIFVVSFFASSH